MLQLLSLIVWIIVVIYVVGFVLVNLPDILAIVARLALFLVMAGFALAVVVYVFVMLNS